MPLALTTRVAESSQMCQRRIHDNPKGHTQIPHLMRLQNFFYCWKTALDLAKVCCMGDTQLQSLLLSKKGKGQLHVLRIEPVLSCLFSFQAIRPIRLVHCLALTCREINRAVVLGNRSKLDNVNPISKRFCYTRWRASGPCTRNA